MDIVRIDGYNDERFSKIALLQHGCFLVDGAPYEVEIVSDSAALIRGANEGCYAAVIEEFRFYSPHIYLFNSASGATVGEYPKPSLFHVALEDIQPSQFYADMEKVNAVKTFIRTGEDIIIQALAHNGRYISLDGHTRLYYAAARGFSTVRAVLQESDGYIYDFVNEAIKRGVTSPRDLTLLSHEEYVKKWHHYCDEFFRGKGE